jgi:lipoprotein-anchoring transpeptidase ErfK/SrfK
MAQMQHLAVRIALVAGLAALSGCSKIPVLNKIRPFGQRMSAADSLAVAKVRTREAVPASPALAAPTSQASMALWREAVRPRGLRIVVSTSAKALWLMQDSTALLRAPVAIGKQEDFTYRGKRYDFDTPTGKRKVLAKGLNPLWTPPDWHYFEMAAEQQLEPVFLKKAQTVRLSDSTAIVVRGDQVGRINRYGNFFAFEPGGEIIFDGKIFIPPLNSAQRRVPKVLGGHKLEMGDGYLIHGTDTESSIGGAVSHGCVRMYNDDVARLYASAPVGTPIYIY